jgi:hypothetical protein
MAGVAQFAVLQKQFAAVSAEHLKRAFSAFANLTDVDAVRLANNARGILMRQLNRDGARAFQKALLLQGVETIVVSDDDLPRLPDVKSLHRIELSPEALIIFDLVGRPNAISWNRVELVAAGELLRFEFGRKEFERPALGFNPITGLWVKKVRDTTHTTEWDPVLVLELVLADKSARYQIEATGFPFKFLVDRPEFSVTQRFIWLVREICRHAPHAVLNHGARVLRDGGDIVPQYEMRQMMADEMVWLLWNASQQTR